MRRDRANSSVLPDGSIELLEVPTVPEPQTPTVVLAEKITRAGDRDRFAIDAAAEVGRVRVDATGKEACEVPLELAPFADPLDRTMP